MREDAVGKTNRFVTELEAILTLLYHFDIAVSRSFIREIKWHRKT